MITMRHPERVKLDHCPPWCAGHNGGYQGWEETGGEGWQERADSSEDAGDEKRCRRVTAVEDSLGQMATPTVDLYLINDREDHRAQQNRPRSR